MVIGIRPKIAVREVRAIGSSLLAAPSAIPSSKLILVFSLTEILSTIKIEFLTTIPKALRRQQGLGRKDKY